jgi:oxygen-independent coproporphyrinogen-3 oxidase
MKENIIHAYPRHGFFLAREIPWYNIELIERYYEMIKVYTNKESFQYDLHSLIKAFYPEHEVKVYDEALKGNDEGDIITVRFLGNIMDVSFNIDGKIKSYNDKYESDEVTKNEYKLSLYRDLCDYTKKTLPWGNLTGIRPTKLAMGMLEESMADKDIIKTLQDTHMVSDEKAWLSLDIAKREKAILDRIHYKDGYSLYIGIPFCPTTCLYCSFTSYPIAIWRKHIQEYLEALFKEIDFVSEFYKDKILDTVYIGGGTPTTLEPDELESLLGRVREKLDFSQVKEFTVEAGRADSITREKLEVLKKYGVTRISVNPQTMNDETLKLIGRRHTVNQVRTAFNLAREVGFDNINMDIILGLPGEKESDVQYTIDEIIKLNPDSLTVHSLAIKRASRLSQWIEENGISTLKNTDTTMKIAQTGAVRLDMKPYYLYRQKNMSGNFENVGYARDGKYGIYNILIMEECQSIVALGAGSITKRVFPDGRIERCDNVKDVALYIERIDEMIERKRQLLA